ncbi:hypothetical protein FE391_05900 [Nonomuraea sp. KC401]|uniref:hypothetical protein n=1 Tax=unclassified Nonomuraea TaxID=2593643 RepID=UPI0010FE518C|nr:MULTISPECIES: hypothetical protein [unclassified Nonomuraea]NBE92363.1 hypothetical protein [Nonomuraea sp. K271]TLF81836.1 hypothetical protein FE391_05900 [Nonomuraea sp. KC401]
MRGDGRVGHAAGRHPYAEGQCGTGQHRQCPGGSGVHALRIVLDPGPSTLRYDELLISTPDAAVVAEAVLRARR